MWTRANCESCGTVHLEGGHYSVGVNSDSGGNYYRFECPMCGETQSRAASEQVAAVLLDLGAHLIDQGPITQAEVDAFARCLACRDRSSQFGELT